MTFSKFSRLNDTGDSLPMMIEARPIDVGNGAGFPGRKGDEAGWSPGEWCGSKEKAAAVMAAEPEHFTYRELWDTAFDYMVMRAYVKNHDGTTLIAKRGMMKCRDYEGHEWFMDASEFAATYSKAS